MKIVYLHQYFVTPAMIGGTRSYEMARRLVAAGHEVHMVTTDQNPTPAFAGGWRTSVEAGITVHWLGVPYRNDMGFTARLRAFARFALGASRQTTRLRGDVIFATSTPLTIAIPALLASAITRRPFVFEVRDLWPDVPIAIGAIRNPIVIAAARFLELLTYRRARHIVALAPGMREEILAKGIEPTKVSVIPNGCDLNVFSAPSGPSPRAEYPWLGDRKLVLFAGTFGAVNGVEYMVPLAAVVAESDPEVRFVLIGHGREWERVRDAAARAGVLGHSVFMFTAVPKTDLVRWLHAADFIVALFTGPRIVWKDAVQNKFFDALAAGRPVASNFDGWQSQVADEERIGIQLDPVDHRAAAHTLLTAMHDTSWVGSARLRARALAEGRFNRDVLATQLDAILTAADA